MSLAHSKLDDFTVIGVNHWNAAVPVREKFSLDSSAREQVLNKAKALGIANILALSTCNRTELSGITDHPDALIRLLLTYSNGTEEEFDEFGFILKGEKAIRHLYEVTVGLDAQILGDLQIVKQVKEAYEHSVETDLLDGEMHRLMQSVFRAHKRIRHETDLGYGAASISYAAVQFAKKYLGNFHNRNILLIGTGKIGKVTCKNLIGLGACGLTLINRSKDRAGDLASKYDLRLSSFDDLQKEVALADLVIVATGANQPVLKPEHFPDSIEAEKVLLDLSVPRNISPEVEQITGIRLANMDQLSDATDETYKQREDSIPAAHQIIDEEFSAYIQWLKEQKVVPTIVALTQKFDAIRQEELNRYKNHFSDESLDKLELVTRRIINKIAAHSIDHLKENQEKSDELTKMIQTMFKLEMESKIEH